jgi:hypothetical protein
MRFDVYGRFQIEVLREGSSWTVYRRSDGKRVRAADLVIPSEIPAAELEVFLDDMFHELSRPGDEIRLLS